MPRFVHFVVSPPASLDAGAPELDRSLGDVLDDHEDGPLLTDGGMVEPRYPMLAGRLERTRDRLRRTQTMLRENHVDEDLYECVTDALAATDAALDIAKGEDTAHPGRRP